MLSSLVGLKDSRDDKFTVRWRHPARSRGGAVAAELYGSFDSGSQKARTCAQDDTYGGRAGMTLEDQAATARGRSLGLCQGMTSVMPKIEREKEGGFRLCKL